MIIQNSKAAFLLTLLWIQIRIPVSSCHRDPFYHHSWIGIQIRVNIRAESINNVLWDYFLWDELFITIKSWIRIIIQISWILNTSLPHVRKQIQFISDLIEKFKCSKMSQMPWKGKIVKTDFTCAHRWMSYSLVEVSRLITKKLRNLKIKIEIFVTNKDAKCIFFTDTMCPCKCSIIEVVSNFEWVIADI